jgi:hypothetical protein
MYANTQAGSKSWVVVWSIRRLENCKIDPTVYSGFAFGMGIERIAMLKYGVERFEIVF